MARFVFILSPERSGSTLLSAALGGNDAVVAPPELHLLRYRDVASWQRAYPAASASLEALFDATGIAPPPDLASYDTLDLYRQIAEQAGSCWIVDKTPAYARSDEALRRAEALSPRYVWLVRHPLGVAASRIETNHRMRREENHGLAARLKYPAYRLREVVRERTGAAARDLSLDWADVHHRIAAFLAGVPRDRWCRVHFESLVVEPESTLARVCALLGIDLEPAMLDPRGNVDPNLAWGIGDEKILAQAGFSRRSADAWRRHYDETQLADAVAAFYQELGRPA